MRWSRTLIETLKENPAEAEVVSHQLLMRGSFIRKVAAGVYDYLPLGRRVLLKIEAIVRQEMDRAGAVEILMPTLQPSDLWRESGRYDAYGPEMLRITDRHERELVYGPTNEEMVTDIFRAYVKSYKALPLNLYHTQWKFRDEVRPRFGVMRGREFLMKDAYSFDIDKDAARRSYNRMYVAYLRAFDRMGLTAIPMRADTGPIGGDLSHEFHVLAETGESQVFLDKNLLDMPIPPADTDFDGDLAPTLHVAIGDALTLRHAGMRPIDIAWLRSAPWRVRLAALSQPPAARAQLKQISHVEIATRPDSRACGAMLAGWLSARLGWSLPHDKLIDARGEPVSVAVVDAEQPLPGVAALQLTFRDGGSRRLSRGAGGLLSSGLRQVLLPDEPAFDLAMNLFTYQPGATLPFVETHVMEHGLVMLAGQGVYYLGHEWMEVLAGDFIWMGPYVPQSFYATGAVPSRYVYYKDVHRDVAL